MALPVEANRLTVTMHTLAVRARASTVDASLDPVTTKPSPVEGNELALDPKTLARTVRDRWAHAWWRVPPDRSQAQKSYGSPSDPSSAARSRRSRPTRALRLPTAKKLGSADRLPRSTAPRTQRSTAPIGMTS
jgi:hypothetical protein